MNYPVAYAVIPEEEKTYIVGSGDAEYGEAVQLLHRRLSA